MVCLLGVVGDSKMYDLNLSGVPSEMEEAICEWSAAIHVSDEEASYAACSAPSIECSALLNREAGASYARYHPLHENAAKSFDHVSRFANPLHRPLLVLISYR